MANWKQPIRKNGERLSGVLAGLFINRIFVTVFSLIFIIVGTLFAVQLGKGYRPSRDGLLQPTGLLSANSFPTGAQVFIDGRLVTATNNTMNLEPGEYEVEIRKEGFTSWAKRLNIQKELVTQTNALLFPSAPSYCSFSRRSTNRVLHFFGIGRASQWTVCS